MTSGTNHPLPPLIVYGAEKPDIRFRFERNGTQRYFCRVNENLHLTEKHLPHGTFEMGRFLAPLCRQYCRPQQQEEWWPCPALVESGTFQMVMNRKALGRVKLRPIPKWEKCAGVQRLLKMMSMPEEQFLFLAYLEDKFGDEADWRDSLVSDWNAGFRSVTEGWRDTSRSARFDQMLWRTLRFPALIPQVWLNWLYAASDEDVRTLDENPSRVDFVAFWRGERHVIEIDGPSHYATFEGGRYVVDEHMYARNLKIERSLRHASWPVTRIARIEVRKAVEEDSIFGWMDLLSVLPFHANAGYPPQFKAKDAVDELESVELPF